MDFFEKTVKDIKALQNKGIQGATNVAKSALAAFEWKAGQIKAKHKKELLGKLEHYKQILFETRPTEPLMRNSIQYVLKTLQKSRAEKPKELSRLIGKTTDDFFLKLKKANETIAEIGARTIKDGSTVFTHCHSTTVLSILKKAWKSGKRFNVICTETRPLFQGHITVKELLKAKIPTTMILDSAISAYARRADIALVGADVITADSSLINKIGTLNLAIACKRVNIPFFSATALAKFDPETILGKAENIEMRPSEEIWGNAPKNLRIENPAFDVTPRELINAYITEEGILAPEAILEALREKQPWILRGVYL